MGNLITFLGALASSQYARRRTLYNNVGSIIYHSAEWTSCALRRNNENKMTEDGHYNIAQAQRIDKVL